MASVRQVTSKSSWPDENDSRRPTDKPLTRPTSSTSAADSAANNAPCFRFTACRIVPALTWFPSAILLVRQTIGAQPRAAPDLVFEASLRRRARLVCRGALSGDRRLAASHRSNELALSPEGKPASNPEMLMSSSSAGQWMPTPPPISRQFWRSRGVPCARRGYHLIGTDRVRPSRKTTSSILLVTRTSCTRTGVSSIAEEVMPSPQQFLSMFLNERRDASQFVSFEAIVRLNFD